LASTAAQASYLWLRERLQHWLIDRRHGLRTSSVVRMKELGLEHPERVSYEASGWAVLRRALRGIEIERNDVLLDVGSSMGRVVFQAALRYPFRRVVGAELSPDLNEIARSNIAASRAKLRCVDIDLHTADAAEWPVPDDVTIVYLYNPVRGDTFRRVLERLVDSIDRAPRRLRGPTP
jgi:hypothetical protein